MEVLLDILLDRAEYLEDKVDELKNNQSIIMEMVNGVIVMNRLLADQEETRREVEQN